MSHWNVNVSVTSCNHTSHSIFCSGSKLEDTKLQKKVGAKSNPNVVWISNVAQNTRASELKAALSSCGKVTGAKVVVNARFPGTCCFGYVTMSSVEDVENVIAKLNNTELNGQIIKIDKVRATQIYLLSESLLHFLPATFNIIKLVGVTS